MQLRRRGFLYAIVALLALSLSGSAQVREITGKVVGVTDGDTITILDDAKRQHKIRLAGIDAPETGQDFGNRAKQELSSLVFGRDVKVQTDKTDRYGRIVGKVIVDGRDVCLAMIKNGFAWHYKKYQDEQSEADRKAYAEAEVNARASKLHIWSHPSPIAPWDFRAGPAIEESLVGKIIGNRNSGIYHWNGCPGFSKVAPANREIFKTPKEAESAGYRAARNCTEAKPGQK